VGGAKLFHLEGGTGSHLLIPNHFSLFPEATNNIQLPSSKKSKLEIRTKNIEQREKFLNLVL
jgi:hypothetical protein